MPGVADNSVGKCKDCIEYSKQSGNPVPKRPAPHPGPRCSTDWRIEVKRREAAAHEKRVQKTYGLPPGAYEALYLAQGGVCAICRRATGKTKRLAVDHDHATGAVRGLLCGPDNRMIGFARDNPEFFDRAAAYLRNPPAKEHGFIWTA